MRSPDDVIADLEIDRSAREEELRLIERLAGEASPADQSTLNRTTILLAYAHLEGFCRFAISSYASALNSLKLPCEEAASAVAAAGMTDVFKALRDTNHKHALFKKSLSDDSVIHMSAREQTFVEQAREFFSQVVKIPDSLVETNYSASCDVIRKLMFQVGLNTDGIESNRREIDRLRAIRNQIAHGDLRSTRINDEAPRFVVTAIRVMSVVQQEITFALTLPPSFIQS